MKFNLSPFSTESDPRNLNYFRIVFCFLCLLRLFFIPWTHYSDIPNELWNPQGILQLIAPTPPPSAFYFFTVTLMFMSLFSLMLGYLTKISAWLSFLTLFYNLGITHSVYFFDHSNSAIVLCLLVLSLSDQIGKDVSIDNWLKKKQVINKNDVNSIWPLRLIQFFIFSIFFASGVSKVVASGLEWAQGANLIGILNFTNIHFSSLMVFEIQHTLNSTIQNSNSIATLLGHYVIFVELICLLFFFLRGTTAIGLFLISTLHIGIFFTTYIHFISFLPLYSVFIPYNKLVELLKNDFK